MGVPTGLAIQTTRQCGGYFWEPFEVFLCPAADLAPGSGRPPGSGCAFQEVCQAGHGQNRHGLLDESQLAVGVRPERAFMSRKTTD